MIYKERPVYTNKVSLIKALIFQFLRLIIVLVDILLNETFLNLKLKLILWKRVGRAHTNYVGGNKPQFFFYLSKSIRFY